VKDKQNRPLFANRSRKSEKDIQYNGRRIRDKRTNNDIHNTTQKN